MARRRRDGAARRARAASGRDAEAAAAGGDAEAIATGGDATAAAGARRPGRLDALALALIVALGATLRFYGLRAQSLWDDELFSRLAGAQPSAARAVAVGAFEDVHPPGYPLFMYAWQGLFGDSEAALRAPSALAGSLAVGVMFLLGRRLFAVREGLVAAALTATLWFPVSYSQENRPYSALLLATALLAYLAAEIVARYREGARPPLALGAAFCLVAVAASYLHYFGLYFVGLLGLLLFGLALRKRLPIAAVAALHAPVVLAYLPWASALASQARRGPIWIPPPSAALVKRTYAFMLNERPEIFGALLVLALASWAMRVQDEGDDLEARVRRPDPRLVLLAAWCTVPVAGAVVISRLVLPVFTERNLIIILPGLCLLLARALTELGSRTRRWPAPAAIVVALALFDLVALREYYDKPTKRQFRESARRVVDESRALPGRPLVVSEAWDPSYFDYYFRHFGSDLRVDVTTRTDDGPKALAERAPENLFLLAAPVTRAGQKRFEPGERYEEVGKWAYLKWDVYKFRRRPEGAPPAVPAPVSP